MVKDIYRISRGIQESTCGIFRSYVKKHRISVVEQEKFMWNFLESCFLALKLTRDVTYIILPNFQGWGFVLPETSRGTEKNQKTSRVSFKKVCPDPPFVFFSGVAHSKTIDLNWSYKALTKKKALTIYQDRAFASFSCVQLLSSVLQRFTHLYCDISSLGERSTGILGNKAYPILFFRIFPIYMFASKYNIKRREKTSALQHFMNCF